MNDFRDLVNVAVIDKLDDLVCHLVEELFKILAGIEEKLDWEHVTHGYGNVILGMIRLEPDINLQILFIDPQIRIQPINFLNNPQPGLRLDTLIIVNFGNNLQHILREQLKILLLLFA